MPLSCKDMRNDMRKFITAALLLNLAAPLLAACNTTAGAGEDVSAAGRAITRGADNVKSGL